MEQGNANASDEAPSPRATDFTVRVRRSQTASCLPSPPASRKRSSTVGLLPSPVRRRAPDGHLTDDTSEAPPSLLQKSEPPLSLLEQHLRILSRSTPTSHSAAAAAGAPSTPFALDPIEASDSAYSNGSHGSGHEDNLRRSMSLSLQRFRMAINKPGTSGVVSSDNTPLQSEGYISSLLDADSLRLGGELHTSPLRRIPASNSNSARGESAHPGVKLVSPVQSLADVERQEMLKLQEITLKRQLKLVQSQQISHRKAQQEAENRSKATIVDVIPFEIEDGAITRVYIESQAESSFMSRSATYQSQSKSGMFSPSKSKSRPSRSSKGVVIPSFLDGQVNSEEAHYFPTMTELRSQELQMVRCNQEMALRRQLELVRSLQGTTPVTSNDTNSTARRGRDPNTKNISKCCLVGCLAACWTVLATVFDCQDCVDECCMDFDGEPEEVFQ